MILFDVLSDVLFFKKGDVMQNIENESEVNPYMLNRWISMHSPESAVYVNLFNNRLWTVLQNKRDWYKFNISLLPRHRFSKISYTKKGTKEKVSSSAANDNKIYNILAHNLELSVREVKSYIADNNIDITNLRKFFKNE